MAGLIAVSTSEEQARFISFFKCLGELHKPEGTVVQFFNGRLSQYNKRNAIDFALKAGLDWIFFLDDDQLLPPDTLNNLIKHNVPVVSVNLLYRNPPFNPYIFKTIDEDGKAFPNTLDECGEGGLVKVEACGCGGLLVRTGVFRKIPAPHFEVNDKLKTEDLFFCNLLKNNDVPLYVDLDSLSGHIVQGVVWPEFDRVTRKWKTSLIIQNVLNLPIPAAVRNGDVFSLGEVK